MCNLLSEGWFQSGNIPVMHPCFVYFWIVILFSLHFIRTMVVTNGCRMHYLSHFDLENLMYYPANYNCLRTALLFPVRPCLIRARFRRLGFLYGRSEVSFNLIVQRRSK